MQLLLDEEFLPFTINLIESAHHSIDISTFKAELIVKPRGKRLKRLFDLIIAKARLGIPVRFLISKRENYGHIPLSNVLAIRELKAAPIKVRHLRNSRLCHAKIIIVDNRFAIIGSHNLSIRSCCENFECSLFYDDEYTVKHLSSVYTRVFEDARKA